MAEFNFPCPHCGQGILCDDQWSGQQIACPACQNDLIVPPNQIAALAAATGPARTRTPIKTSSRKNTSKPSAARLVIYAALALVLGGGLFYLFTHADSWQHQFNQKQKELGEKSGGGELGHMADLYDVLDKTDPDRVAREGLDLGPRHPRSSGDPSPRPRARIAAEPAQGGPKPADELPLAPADWTLDVESVTIPDGRANGTLSGTNFVVETVRLDRAGVAQVLTLRQGAEREVFIYLSLNPTESVTGRTWTISKDMKGKGVPQVIKRWKTNPRYAPVQKSFASGYAMKLELGEATDDGAIPGKIFLALPDAEKSVVAGTFKTGTALAQARSAPAVEPSAAPLKDPKLRQRYGLDR